MSDLKEQIDIINSKYSLLNIPLYLTLVGKEVIINSTAEIMSMETFVIPDIVTIIGENCFGYSPFLREVILSKNLRVIGVEAFFCCKSLESVKSRYRNEITLEPHCFKGCTCLKELDFNIIGLDFLSLPVFSVVSRELLAGLRYIDMSSLRHQDDNGTVVIDSKRVAGMFLAEENIKNIVFKNCTRVSNESSIFGQIVFYSGVELDSVEFGFTNSLPARNLFVGDGHIKKVIIDCDVISEKRFKLSVNGNRNNKDYFLDDDKTEEIEIGVNCRQLAGGIFYKLKSLKRLIFRGKTEIVCKVNEKKRLVIIEAIPYEFL